MAQKTNPKLWQSIVDQVKSKTIGGTNAGQWSARKAQIAVKKYKSQDGRYIGPKQKSNSLVQWSEQHWTTKSGRPNHITHERYLPVKAIQALSANEYALVTREKRRDTKNGLQY